MGRCDGAIHLGTYPNSAFSDWNIRTLKCFQIDHIIKSPSHGGRFDNPAEALRGVLLAVPEDSSMRVASLIFRL